ncbi:hypothetical protein KUCAC02_005558, partial [Chaenocephalus aceratus]
MGAGLIRIILTGLDFDVLLPITDITGRQAYFSLITSNSCTGWPYHNVVCVSVCKSKPVGLGRGMPRGRRFGICCFVCALGSSTGKYSEPNLEGPSADNGAARGHSESLSKNRRRQHSPRKVPGSETEEQRATGAGQQQQTSVNHPEANLWSRWGKPTRARPQQRRDQLLHTLNKWHVSIGVQPEDLLQQSLSLYDWSK